MRINQARIQINVKLFSGLDTSAAVTDYDSEKGIALDLRDGTRIKQVLKALKLYPLGSLVVFVNGHKASIQDTLDNGDVLFCMKPVSGG